MKVNEGIGWPNLWAAPYLQQTEDGTTNKIDNTMNKILKDSERFRKIVKKSKKIEIL